MSETHSPAPAGHDHVFLGDNHQRNERRTWFVIALTAGMMVAEIAAGTFYGSMALVADGWHMSTHAAALLIAALAYLYARRNARNPRFTFGTGKLGDLAGFSSAIVLALIALLIGWESLLRLANPVAISFPSTRRSGKSSMPTRSSGARRSGRANLEGQMRDTQEIRFAVLMFPNFPLMAFSSVIEPLRAANTLSGRRCYSWLTVAAGEKISASNGIGIEPDFHVRNAPEVDRIVVCSGGDAEHLVADEEMAWIRKNLRAGAQLGAVADAAFFLARKGLLDGHSCTLHWTSQPAFKEAFPHLDMRSDLYVIDRRRFTSVGGIGSLDMMLDMIGRDYGAELADGVAGWFMHSPLRPDADRRKLTLRIRSGIADDLVLSAVAMMEDAIEDVLRIEDLASRLNVSSDKLERAFKAELGVSPNSYYRNLRLGHAADMLTHSNLKVNEVAVACGFVNAANFSRAFKEQFGYVPHSVRRRVSRAGEAPRAVAGLK